MRGTGTAAHALRVIGVGPPKRRGTAVARLVVVRLLLLLLVLVSGCEKSSDAAPPAIDGETVFMRACAHCHQADGRGVRGSFPSLVVPRYGDKAIQISIVLNGMRMMPANRDLSDGQLAAVLTYIRTSWGNTLEPVSATDVARSRF